MGKIIDRIRKREAVRAAKFRRENPLYSLLSQAQQDAARVGNLLDSRNPYVERMRGMQNAYKPFELMPVERKEEKPRPWWRFW